MSRVCAFEPGRLSQGGTRGRSGRTGELAFQLDKRRENRRQVRVTTFPKGWKLELSYAPPPFLSSLPSLHPFPLRSPRQLAAAPVRLRRLEIILTSEPNQSSHTLRFLANRENSKKSFALRARRPEDRRATGSLSCIHMYKSEDPFDSPFNYISPAPSFFFFFVKRIPS